MQVDDDMYPQSSVVYIGAKYGDEIYVGTGILVGRNDVLTASHIVYRTGYGPADAIAILPSYNPSDDNTAYKALFWDYYTDFDPDGDGLVVDGDNNLYTREGSEIDIALITLEDPIGDTYGWMGMREYFQNGNVAITGHPYSYNGFMSEIHITAYRDSIDNFIHVSGNGIGPGSSGSPVWIDTVDGPIVVGIISSNIAAATIDGNGWLFDLIRDNDIYIKQENSSLLPAEDIELVASIYQFFTGSVPTAEGFVYLINSDANPTDLHDPYYAAFNRENLYLNFSSNLGTFGAGSEKFYSMFKNMDFHSAVYIAYDAIVGIDDARDAGIDVDAAIAFFDSAYYFYASVAWERVVPSGVQFDDAVNIVLIGSVIDAAMKAGVGELAEAVKAFTADYLSGGAADFGFDLLA